MIYKKYKFHHSDDQKIQFLDIFGLHPQFLKTFKAIKVKWEVFLLMRVIFRPHPKRWLVARRTNHVIKGLKLSVPRTLHPDLRGEERGWRLNQPVANNLAYHDYIMNPPYKTQENIFLVLWGEFPCFGNQNTSMCHRARPQAQ